MRNKESDKGVSSETLRATMAATGGRNQRRIANLKSENVKSVVDIDIEKDILLESVTEQRKMTSHLEWNDEKDRLTSLVAISDKVVGLPELEKNENVRALNEFLRKPRTTESDSKRQKLLRHNTPASAIAFSSTSLPTSSSRNIPEDDMQQDEDLQTFTYSPV